jgi:hypothetical protein
MPGLPFDAPHEGARQFEWISYTLKVPYCGNQDDGQDVADDTDDDGGYGADEDLTGGSPTGEREP